MFTMVEFQVPAFSKRVSVTLFNITGNSIMNVVDVLTLSKESARRSWKEYKDLGFQPSTDISLVDSI